MLLAVSLALRFSSSTSCSFCRRLVSNATSRSMSHLTPRLAQFVLTRSAFSIISFRSSMLLSQLLPKVGAGLDSAVEIGQAEFFVGTVRVVVVQAPAQ